MEDRLERPIERLTQQINILGDKIKGTQSIIPADGGSTFKKEDKPILTPVEKSRERQKAIEFGKALGIGNYATKGKLEDLTPSAIKPTVAAAVAPSPQKEGFSVLGMIGKVIGTVFKILNFVSLYKLIRPYIEKWFGKNVVTDTIFGILDPIVKYIDTFVGYLKKMFINWFKNTFPETYKVITGVVDSVKKAFKWVWEKVRGVYDWLKEFFGSENKIDFIKDALKGAFAKVSETISQFFNGLLPESSGGFFEKIKAGVVELYEKYIQPYFDKITSWFIQKYEEIKSYISGIYEDAKKYIEDKLKEWGITELVKNINDFIEKVKVVADNFNLLIDEIRVWVKEVKDKIVEAFNRVIGFIDNIEKSFNDLKEQVKSKIEDIGNAIKDIINSVKTAIVSGIDNIKIAIISTIQGIGNAITNIMNAVASAITSIVSAAKSAASTVVEAPGKAVEWVDKKTGGAVQKAKQGASTVGEKIGGAWEATKNFFGFGKKANDFLVSKRGEFVNFSNQDNVLGFKDGGSIDRVLGRKDDALISDTRQILIESRKQVSLLQKIVENTYNANLLLQKLSMKGAQSTVINNQTQDTKSINKFNRSEFDVETSPLFNLATI